jgi:hypothetical protein
MRTLLMWTVNTKFRRNSRLVLEMKRKDVTTYGHAQASHCALNLCALCKYCITTVQRFSFGRWVLQTFKTCPAFAIQLSTVSEKVPLQVYCNLPVKRPFPTTVCISRLFLGQRDSQTGLF